MVPVNSPETARWVPAAFKAQSMTWSSSSASSTRYHNKLPDGLYFEITDESNPVTDTFTVTAGFGSTSYDLLLVVRKWPHA